MKSKRGSSDLGPSAGLGDGGGEGGAQRGRDPRLHRRVRQHTLQPILQLRSPLRGDREGEAEMASGWRHPVRSVRGCLDKLQMDAALAAANSFPYLSRSVGRCFFAPWQRPLFPPVCFVEAELAPLLNKCLPKSSSWEPLAKSLMSSWVS